jgi:SAM-dependent methyltransferase
MNEAGKAAMRRLHDSRFATRYFVGDGIDIGAGKDALGLYFELYPQMRSCRAWDKPDGDAQRMEGVPDARFDFVHSSHCLEHMREPAEALRNWLRILKPGGHLVVTVPDEDLYEQGVWPSTFNRDHKWTFTTCKPSSWSPRSINLTELLARFAGDAHVPPPHQAARRPDQTADRRMRDRVRDAQAPRGRPATRRTAPPRSAAGRVTRTATTGLRPR